MSDRDADPIRGFFLMGLMLGGAVGAALGLLYAPRPGAHVRHELSERSERLVDRARTAAESARADRDVAAPSGEQPADDPAVGVL